MKIVLAGVKQIKIEDERNGCRVIVLETITGDCSMLLMADSSVKRLCVRRVRRENRHD